jgi:hypothetical protein
MSNQNGDFYKFKNVFDGQYTRQKTQMLPVSDENTYVIELKSHIEIIYIYIQKQICVKVRTLTTLLINPHLVLEICCDTLHNLLDIFIIDSS